MTQPRFSPDKIRQRLQGSFGYELALRDDYAQVKAASGLASSANALLGEAIQCFLVGFDEPAQRLLTRASEWIKIAITSDERPERYFPGATEAMRYQTLALCNWFLFDVHDRSSLHQYVQGKDQYLNNKKRRDRVGVSFSLVTYVDAGVYARTLEVFESTPGLSPPTGASPRNEAQLAYIICRNRLGLDYGEGDVQSSTASFRRGHIDAWLDDGQWVRAAEWLKVVHWNEGDRTVSAKRVLLKCYDYLPGVHPPS